MAKASTIKYDFTTRWAGKNELGDIIRFLNQTHLNDGGILYPYSPATLERTRETYAAAVDDERVLLLIDSHNNIKAFGVLHLHPASVEIGKAVDTQATDRFAFNIAEIDLAHYPGEHKSSDFCAELIYDILIVQTMRKAQECTIKPNYISRTPLSHQCRTSLTEHSLESHYAFFY